MIKSDSTNITLYSTNITYDSTYTTFDGTKLPIEWIHTHKKSVDTIE